MSLPEVIIRFLFHENLLQVGSNRPFTDFQMTVVSVQKLIKTKSRILKRLVLIGNMLIVMYLGFYFWGFPNIKAFSGSKFRTLFMNEILIQVIFKTNFLTTTILLQIRHSFDLAKQELFLFSVIKHYGQCGIFWMYFK